MFLRVFHYPNIFNTEYDSHHAKTQTLAPPKMMGFSNTYANLITVECR